MCVRTLNLSIDICMGGENKFYKIIELITVIVD